MAGMVLYEQERMGGCIRVKVLGRTWRCSEVQTWIMRTTHRFIWDDNSDKRMEVRGCIYKNYCSHGG